MSLKQLSLEEFANIARDAQRVVVYREIMADRLTPVGIVEQLQEEMREGCLLESGLQQTEEGRYSYITFGLMAQLSAKGNQITQRMSESLAQLVGDPFVVLRQLVAEFACANPPHDLLRMHTAVGFVTYDAVRLRDNIPDRHEQEIELPDIVFNFYHTTLIFDHLQHTLLLAKMVEVDGNANQVYDDATVYLQSVINKISETPKFEADVVLKKSVNLMPEVDISDQEFMLLVERAKDHIRAGDAFQIVLSRCFKQRYSAKPFDIYRALRTVSPAPYMFYFPMNHGVMAGASPEKMISVRQGVVEINPIAGTRSRTTQADEANNAAELLADEKELAEHRMLVDLARNDLGAVCQPGTVQIKNLLQVKHFSHVSHLTSSVTGTLAAGKDALDALQATFPAGTVSGAPKIRAMEVIDALETSRRGLYGGALCRMDALGNLDSCIAIRMAMLRDGVATIRTGAGIVADSNPASEAAETYQKASGVLAAIAVAEEGVSC